VIPLFTAEFCRFYPDVGVELRVDNTAVVLEAVRESDYPFGLVEGNPRAAGLRLEKFVDDELVLVAGTNKSYAKYQRLAAAVAAPQDLYRIPLIWREAGSGTRAVAETALRKSGIQLRRLTYQYVMADVQAIKTAVVHCLGFSFLSRWSVKNEVAAGQLRILQIPNLTVRRGFFWVLPSGALGDPSDSFVRFCQANPAQLASAQAF
jgi:DNA-binding transcriptional LysR family regulator